MPLSNPVMVQSEILLLYSRILMPCPGELSVSIMHCVISDDEPWMIIPCAVTFVMLQFMILQFLVSQSM